jgi:hypothetical protein
VPEDQPGVVTLDIERAPAEPVARQEHDERRRDSPMQRAEER